MYKLVHDSCCFEGRIAMKSAKEIGQDLILLRGATSREDVAVAIGVSVLALQMYENGERRPRDETKVALAAYYHTTVGSLFFNENVHDSCTI